jgi:hypothetical protein
MTKEQFFTTRWNNIISLILGIPSLIYAIVALATPVASGLPGFIALGVIGAVF